MKSVAKNAPIEVLVADDDPAMLRVFSKWLGSAGYQVQCVGDGRQAQAAIESNCPQFLIADWEMPHCDGIELCQWLRQQSLPHYVHTLLVTVRTSSNDMIRGLEAGADDFLRKPVDRNELLARMQGGLRVLEMERRLSLMAKLDPLSGLATQRTLIDEMEREWSRTERYQLDLSCVMLDIDFFKRVNDTHGHAVGDEAIRRVAQVLTSCCRASDLVSRYGGEEFCILLPETTERSAALWAERARAKIAAERIVASGKSITLTASFGVAQRLSDSASSHELLDLADQALLVAKKSGRDRVVAYSSLGNLAAMAASAEGTGRLFHNLLAGDCMNATVAPLREDDTLENAVDYFLRLRHSSAPVVDAEGKLSGILSEKDALGVLLWPDWRTARVADIMKRNVVSYPESTPVLAIYDFLCRVSIRGVVIVNEGRPVGIINRGNLLRWCLLKGSGLAGDELLGEDLANNDTLRTHLNGTASQLAEEATRLCRSLAQPSNDVVPQVVGGASRMQELLNDLLASSRSAQRLSQAEALSTREGCSPSNESASGLLAALAGGGLSAPAEAEVWFPPGCEPDLPA